MLWILLETLRCYFGLAVLDLCKQIGIVPVFEFPKIICFCLRFHTKLQFFLFLFFCFDLPARFAPALVSLSSHTCFGQEGGVWGSHCLYLNGSVRWAIDDGVQSLLIPSLGETLWCGGTWKERAAAQDPKWSLTIIKYYHPEAGVGGQRYRAAAEPERRGVCCGPGGWSPATPPPF